MIRQPITWDGCFGWIHHAPNCATSDVVAVICPGVGRDSSTGYRPARLLADSLAIAGYTTIRFSYPGTGDSADPVDENWWPAWTRSLHAAINRACAVAGVEQVVLIGIRLGAALAALAATERKEVVGLVLLEPVVRGSSFATQLRIEERMSMRVEHDDIWIHGLHLTARALDSMRRLDLRALTLRPGCRIMVLSEARSASLRACEESWSLQGVDVVHEDADEIRSFFCPTHLADESSPDMQSLIRWFQGRFPAREGVSAFVPVLGRGALTGPGWIETPHVFGADGHLFGILCEPGHSALCDTVVIIGNSGGDPHDGFARFAVEFARLLAQGGIASFRIDFAGLGDSLNAADDPDGLTHPFTVDRRPDFAAAVDFVSNKGFRTIALQGLCSGAYHALQAAVTDPRVTVLLCVNLPWFSLRHERAGPASFARHAVTNLAAREVRCLLLFAEDDAGLKPLEQNFGPSGADFSAQAGFEILISGDIDHDLTRPEMRRLAAQWMMMFLGKEPHDVDSVVYHRTGSSGCQATGAASRTAERQLAIVGDRA